jgi:hypothetical protein
MSVIATREYGITAFLQKDTECVGSAFMIRRVCEFGTVDKVYSKEKKTVFYFLTHCTLHLSVR